jgi:OOP family OmpA-OmpF porin
VKKQYQDPIMAPLKGGRKVPYTIPTKKILFDEWSYAIKEQSLSELQDFGNALEREFAQDPNQSVLIEGHTDARGAYDRNVTLSKERAEAVKDYLVKTCNIDPNRLSTRGWGPDKPFSEQDNSSWALNRRVQFTLSK